MFARRQSKLDKNLAYLGWRRPDGHDDAKDLGTDDSYMLTRVVDHKGKLRKVEEVEPEVRKAVRKRQLQEAQRAGAKKALARE